VSEFHTVCHACEHCFAPDSDDLKPYQSAYIQGNRPPEYVVRCPACGAKNLIRLIESGTVIGKPVRT